MELRNGTVVGHGLMPHQYREAFEQGVSIVFSKWTALNLAVENEWGGPYSKDKAQQFIVDTLHWFYKRKEHWEDDLEIELDEGLMQDFNVQAEDGSPREVAKALVKLYQECHVGDFAFLQSLQAMPSGAAASRREGQGEGAHDDGDDDTSSSDEEGEGEAMDADAPGAGALPHPQEPVPKLQPIIDDDGFELVTRRSGRRR